MFLGPREIAFPSPRGRIAAVGRTVVVEVGTLGRRHPLQSGAETEDALAGEILTRRHSSVPFL